MSIVSGGLRRSVHSVAIRIALASVLGFAAAAAPEAHAAGLSGKKGVFKVVKPPNAGAKRRLILNQAPQGLPPSSRPSSARHGWFWNVASPLVADADEARAKDLAAAAAKRIGGEQSRLLVEKISVAFRKEIRTASQKADVSPAFLIAVIAAESRGQPNATSKKGAQGLAQLMPATAKRYGVTDAYDPAQNLNAAAAFLNSLLKRFDEDALLALAGYNAGPNAVRRNNGVPPYAETRDYIPIVLSYFHDAAQLCLRPPAGPRGACTFRSL